MNVENVHSSGHSPVSQIATHILCILSIVPSLLLLWTVLLGPHQDLWLCDLQSDGWHEQPLNEVVEALAPNTLVQFLSIPHHSTSLHNTLSICLRFVQLQSNFRQLLTGYIPDVGDTVSCRETVDVVWDVDSSGPRKHVLGAGPCPLLYTQSTCIHLRRICILSLQIVQLVVANEVHYRPWSQNMQNTAGNLHDRCYAKSTNQDKQRVWQKPTRRRLFSLKLS